MGAEEIELPLLLIPVAANALEAGSAIVEGMGHHPDLGLGQGEELSVEKGVGWHRHSPFSEVAPLYPATRGKTRHEEGGKIVWPPLSSHRATLGCFAERPPAPPAGGGLGSTRSLGQPTLG